MALVLRLVVEHRNLQISFFDSVFFDSGAVAFHHEETGDHHQLDKEREADHEKTVVAVNVPGGMLSFKRTSTS